MSFAEAMAWPETPTSSERSKGGLDLEAGEHDPRAMPSLAEAVARFSAVAKASRGRCTQQGAAMPEEEAEAWTVLLREVEGFLSRPLANSSALDAVRTRLQLESELEADAQTWGDVPPEIAEGAQRALRRLSQKLTALSARQQRADPAHFAWPIAPVVVTSPYGHRVHPLSGDYRFHAGIDLEAEDAQPVYAAETGLVVFAGWNGAHGRQIEVQHDPHVTTRYSHLQSLLVPPGKVVKKGALLGLAGHTGQVTGTHLHFELRRDGDALDPEVLLPAPPRSPRLVWR